jgi:hypothetical protein
MSSPEGIVQAVPGLQAQGYSRHPLHGEDSAWPEKNCYADLWIELLHSLSLEPRAVLPFTLAVDFEGDQWTFFKPPLSDLRELYGIDVQELTVWRRLIDHAVEHLGAGKLISTEADAYWLPDTVGTDYRTQHTKTTILLDRLDLKERRLGYFHNAGYFELSGEDFAQIFRLDASPDPAFMPLFAELVRIERRVQLPELELAALSLALLRRYAAWRPASNPFQRFAARLDSQLAELRAAGLPQYHAWAFAAIRQAGAAFELAAANLRWLADQGYAELGAAAPSFDAISQANKALILKGARSVHTGKPLDASALVGDMARAWEEGMATVEQGLKHSP